jgi:hypothetical protein
VKPIRQSLFLCAALLAPAKLFACATCYGGDIDTPMTNGMNWGIFTLLAAIGTVLAVFLTFLIYAIRKSEALNAAAERNLSAPEVSKV